ncbi:MAG: hypothetical protein NT069_15030 [Planctomycetota bacterium]|nr:hypothetical protein [Planctomycetota bacterium]
MIPVEQEMESILVTVREWSASSRIVLAPKVLEPLGGNRRVRGPAVSEVLGMLNPKGLSLEDEACRRIVDEVRLRKYAQ